MAASSNTGTTEMKTTAGIKLLKNGFIVDGTGRKGFTGDLLIREGEIEAVSSSLIDIDCETMDCSGLVVSPGFIDAHSHMDWILCMEGFDRLKSPYAAQGCTTFVTGNCGYSPGGFRKNSPFKEMLKLGADRGFDLYWDTMGDYFSHLKKVGLSHNVVHLAGHGTTQASMRGLDPNPLDDQEMKELLFLLEEAMDEGAAGVEKGLETMSQILGFGYNDIQLTYAGHPDFDLYNGMFIGEISQKAGMRPAQVVLGLSEKTNGRARILNHNYSNMEIIDALIQNPGCLFMTDAVVSVEGVQNPASFGAFPLLLQYSRDRNLLSLEEAVYKMTGATADRFNIRDRGVLKPGMAADITIFDWENLKDNNTVEATDQAPTGIEAVFMNGRQVKRNGEVDTSVNAGVVVFN